MALSSHSVPGSQCVCVAPYVRNVSPRVVTPAAARATCRSCTQFAVKAVLARDGALRFLLLRSAFTSGHWALLLEVRQRTRAFRSLAHRHTCINSRGLADGTIW